jgi:hypothetical protein
MVAIVVIAAFLFFLLAFFGQLLIPSFKFLP